MDECRLEPSLSFNVFEVRRLTYYLSGVPKARPLEGLVSWRVSDAPPKGLIECAAERGGARFRWTWQRLTCIRSLYFKLGAMANASTRAGQSRAQVSLAAAQCAARLRRRYQALHLCVPVRLDSGSKGGRGRQRNFTRESEDRSLRRACKAVLIHKPKQRWTARQQATESQLTFDLSGPP